jgi:hypothetical protein
MRLGAAGPEDLDGYTEFAPYAVVPASYTLWETSSKYHAVPSFSGGARYSGASFSAVVQQVCDALTAGGAVAIKRGTYVADATIYPRSDQWFIGEGPATVIVRSANVPIFSFQEQKGHPAYQRNNALLNVALNGNGTAADLIQVWNLQLSYFEKITLENFAGNGFYVSGEGMKSIYNQFRDVELATPTVPNSGSLFHLTQGTSDSYIDGVQGSGNNEGIIGVTAAGAGGYMIRSFHVDRLKNTLVMDSTTYGVEAIFFVDSFIDMTQEHGIIFRAVNHGIQSCVIANNYVISPCQAVANAYDVFHLDAGAQWIIDVLIQGNRGKFEKPEPYRYAYNQVLPTGGGYARIRYVANALYEGTSGLYNNVPAWSSQLAFDTHFVTQGRGSGVGTGAQQAIAHGCSGTPDASQVFLSEKDTGGARPYQSAPPDATNIYVKARRNRTFNWKVEL